MPCRIVFAKPEDLVTWSNHLSFRFWTKVRSSSYIPIAAWMFCEYPHWWNGHCMRCSVTFGSISSQRPASFSLALLSKSMTRRLTEIWIWQGSASVLHQDNSRAIMKGYGSPFAIENIYAFGNGNRDCCISKMIWNNFKRSFFLRRSNKIESRKEFCTFKSALWVHLQYRLVSAYNCN